MEPKEKEYKIYSIAQYIVENVLGNKIVYHNFDELEISLAKANLSDCESLMRILKREIKNHNAEIIASMTRLNKTEYSTNWLDNALFQRYKSVFSYPKILKCVEENPDMSSYNIYYKYFRVQTDK
jgi:hypothetical protein